MRLAVSYDVVAGSGGGGARAARCSRAEETGRHIGPHLEADHSKPRYMVGIMKLFKCLARRQAIRPVESFI